MSSYGNVADYSNSAIVKTDLFGISGFLGNAEMARQGFLFEVPLTIFYSHTQWQKEQRGVTCLVHETSKS